MTAMLKQKMPEITIKCPTRFHLPCVILLDKSGSMYGGPINALNEALIDFKGKFESDNEDHSVIDLCIIAFGGKGDGSEPDIEILQPFAPANEMTYDTKTKPLIAYGGTPLAQAVELGLKEIARIKQKYRDCAVDYWRPWLICVTDGESTEEREYYNCVKVSLKKETEGKHVNPWGIGVGDYCNYKELYDFFGEGHAFILEDYNFKGLVSLLKDMMNDWFSGYYPRENETKRDKEKPILKQVVFDDDSEEDSDDEITDSEQANEVFADDSETGDADEKPVLDKITFDD